MASERMATGTTAMRKSAISKRSSCGPAHPDLDSLVIVKQHRQVSDVNP